MPSELCTGLLPYLRRVTAPAVEHGGDGQLLHRFATQRDGTAFAALLQRHGPMVLGVCLRVLRHRHDAEDAFQATFLVLARKAGSVVRPDHLANWLYGVALRTALEAKTRRARRQFKENQAVNAAPVNGTPVDAGADTALHGSERNIEDFTDLFVGELMKVRKQQNFPQMLRHVGYGAVDELL